eukprot:5488313-Pyramimonas_sp.AAC.1
MATRQVHRRQCAAWGRSCASGPRERFISRPRPPSPRTARTASGGPATGERGGGGVAGNGSWNP